MFIGTILFPFLPSHIFAHGCGRLLRLESCIRVEARLWVFAGHADTAEHGSSGSLTLAPHAFSARRGRSPCSVPTYCLPTGSVPSFDRIVTQRLCAGPVTCRGRQECR